MTPKERAAMQQALDALETDEQWGFVNKKVLERRLPAITALRSALADSAAFSSEALAEQDDGSVCGRCGGIVYDPVFKQAEQEPVASMFEWRNGNPVRTKDLTDEELAGACGWKLGDPMYEWVVDIGRWAIAADREKNK